MLERLIMCTDAVAHSVRERIKKEGLPNFSRRNFLKVGSILAAGLAVAKPAVADSHTTGAVVDLSHSLSPDFPVFPGFNQAEKINLVTVEVEGFYAQQWTFGEHTSTHMDFPAHFIGDGLKVDEVPPSMLIGAGVVIDIAAKAEENSDATVSVEDIQAWESANGDIPEGAFVLMYSGWDKLLGEQAFLGDGESLHFPGFSAEAAEYLVSEKNIHGIGVDTLSLDHGISQTFDAHYTILGAGLLGIENLANLGEISGHISTIICGIPKYEAGSGGPARILAMM